MESGTRVELVTFNGLTDTPPGCKPQENYWALIGSAGTVLAFNPNLRRYLVKFDPSVQEFGLHCHNPEPNSLYILGSDLRVIGAANA